MNSLKTMATAAIMVAGLYGVYILLNRTPSTSPSPEMAQEWDNLAGNGELGSAPSVDISLPTNEVDPSGLTELSADQAFASMSNGSYGNPAQNGLPNAGIPSTAGVTVPTAVPIGDQFNPNVDTTSGMAFDNSTPGNDYDSPTANPNPTMDPNAAWQDKMQQVNRQLAENRLADAHRDLSQVYADPNTPPEKKKEIEPLLDQLAGTVVYSRDHLLEQPYKATPSDTLEIIAQRFNIPVGLLAKINSLDPSAPLQPGQELKVLQGPFSAMVDLSDHTLTLMTADGRYAGRFPVGVGPQTANITRPSFYMVTDKTDTSSMFDEGRTQIGRRWIGLGEQLGLHGTDSPASVGTSTGNGVISLGDRDIEDIYDILSIGSKVTIQP